MLKLIGFIIVVYVIYRVLLLTPLGKEESSKKAKDDAASKPPEADVEKPSATVMRDGVETALDEVCKSYVPVDMAMKATIDGNVRYFCSGECYHKFVNGRSRPY